MNKWNSNTLLGSIKQYWYLYILLCGWVIYYFVKANTMSIGHDEAGTWLNICKIPFIDFFVDKSKWSDANNHLLNTGAIQLLTHFLSPTLLVLRLPNILAGILFGITTIRIAQLFQLTIIPAFALFVFLHASPFVIDFFCLARGYGLCTAFAVLSLYYALCYLTYFQNKYLIKVLLASFFMIAANFIGIQFLIANCILLVVIPFFNSVKSKSFNITIQSISILAIGSFIILFPFIKILKWLKDIGEFKWGTGTLKSTFESFLNDVMYQNGWIDKHWLYVFFILYVIVLGLGLFYHFKRNTNFKNQFLIAFPLVMLCTMIGLHFLTGAQYPETRKAILYYSTISMSLYFGLQIIESVFNHKIIFQICISFFASLFFVHFLVTTQKNYNREWWYDVDDYKMISYAIQQSENKKFSIATHWFFMPALEYYRTTQFVDKFNLAPYSKTIDTVNAFNYYYVFESDTAILMHNYKIDTMIGSGRFLLKHK